LRHRRGIIAGVLLALLGVTPAGAFPTQPIQVIVPFAPGGSTDIVARTLAPAMERTLGQPVIIVNRPGAAGAVGLQSLASAQPDGHTIGIAPSSFATLPELDRLQGRSSTYTPDQTTLLAGITDDPLVLVVRSDSRWRTARDLIDDAKRRSDQVTLRRRASTASATSAWRSCLARPG